MREKYYLILQQLFVLDTSLIISCFIMFIPIYISIPYSLVKLGIDLTNICLFVYLCIINISMLLYLPLCAFYFIQKDKRKRINEVLE